MTTLKCRPGVRLTVGARPSLRRTLRAYLRRLHNRTSGTLVPTEEVRDRLRGLGFERLRILERGVDTRLFTPERRSRTLRESWGASEHDLVALHVGRIAPEKNLPLAVEAYRAMQRDTCGLRFVLVGDGPARAGLQRAHPDLTFAGVVTGERLAAHYASADVFVFPSETETFGNVTLEAMASGLVVVAYDYAAAHRHITHGETGVLVPRGERGAFVAAATALVRAPGALVGMRRRARAAVARVDWPRVVARFESILTGAGEHDDGGLVVDRREAS